MRNAETILAIIRERGRRGLPLEQVYRQLSNPDLYVRAYGKIAQNRAALTPGSTSETADAMALSRIQALIDDLRHERYRWTPVRRAYIPKSNGKTRPLGVTAWRDKLLQGVLRAILESYYEPQFSVHSHGFRLGKGCHTALEEIQAEWSGTTWFVEGDVVQCFDRLDHLVLLAILSEQIHDGRFIRLIANLLKAGYLEDWRYHPTWSGTPQGAIVSPVPANIYLDRLDRFVGQTLMPDYNRGARRKNNPAYHQLVWKVMVLRQAGRYSEAEGTRKQFQKPPCGDPNDPDHRRLRYVRYTDDFLLGFAGPRAEAEAIKHRLATFMRDTLKLELSDTKTVITHARTASARFLGYDIALFQCDHKRSAARCRSINGRICLRVPPEVVREKCRPYRPHGKAVQRTERQQDSPFSMVARYQTEYRGLVEYYRQAHNLSVLDELHWVMESSLLKTLATKLRLTVR
jgi:group II intron reverse transcriptase/maturase